MKAKWTRDFKQRSRTLTLTLEAADLEGLPETLRQEFFRAEHSQRLPQLLSAWSRIVGLQPTDPQGDLFGDEAEAEAVGVGEDDDAQR